MKKIMLVFIILVGLGLLWFIVPIVKTLFAVAKPYSTDSQYVYDSAKRIIPDADPKTFTLVYRHLTEDSNYNIYYKDKNHVFYQKHDTSKDPVVMISGADPETFDVVTAHGDFMFAKDKNHVYNNGIEVSSADPLTYQSYGGTTAFSNDKTHVFCNSDGPQIISNVDAEGFSILKHPDGQYSDYAITDTSVLYDRTCSVVPGADPKTFKLLSAELAEVAADSYGIYIDGQSVPVDMKTFELVLDAQNNTPSILRHGDGWVSGFKDKDHEYTFLGQGGLHPPYALVK